MNQILVLHAGSRAVRLHHHGARGGSSGANLFACVAAGLASLWGPMHGGANESSMRMLEKLKASIRFRRFCVRQKRDPQAFRRLGFGKLTLPSP